MLHKQNADEARETPTIVSPVFKNWFFPWLSITENRRNREKEAARGERGTGFYPWKRTLETRTVFAQLSTTAVSGVVMVVAADVISDTKIERLGSQVRPWKS